MRPRRHKFVKTVVTDLSAYLSGGMHDNSSAGSPKTCTLAQFSNCHPIESARHAQKHTQTVRIIKSVLGLGIMYNLLAHMVRLLVVDDSDVV